MLLRAPTINELIDRRSTILDGPFFDCVASTQHGSVEDHKGYISQVHASQS
jgi:hypothetical protein